jgi:hypothetical protein
MPFNRTITEEERIYRHIDGGSLSYRLFRNPNRRRSLTMRMRGGELEISVPKRAAVRVVEDFIASRWDLIQKWRQAHAERREKEQEAQKSILSERRIPYLGGSIPFTVEAGRGGYRLTEDGLRLFTARVPQTEADLMDLLCRWYKLHAKKLFSEALEERIVLSGLPADYRQITLRVSSAKTRWGSCSSRRTVSLNWRLLFYDKRLLDYVLCHELAHLREMNHSARFWKQVEAYYPNFREVRGELKKIRLDSSLFG